MDLADLIVGGGLGLSVLAVFGALMWGIAQDLRGK
jgi:hypothetical protein